MSLYLRDFLSQISMKPLIHLEEENTLLFGKHVRQSRFPFSAGSQSQDTDYLAS